MQNHTSKIIACAEAAHMAAALKARELGLKTSDINEVLRFALLANQVVMEQLQEIDGSSFGKVGI